MSNKVPQSNAAMARGFMRQGFGHDEAWRRARMLADDGCFGMDVPTDPWTDEDVRFWTGTPTYQPWKDVAAFFRGT